MSLTPPSTPEALTASDRFLNPEVLFSYPSVRRQTETLAEPLEPEDFVVQSMPDASPVKWHMAHTTWFFETFVLSVALPDYQPRFPQYNYLFNSYYNSIGERIARDKRGLLSRPTIGEVRRYRSEIDSRMEDWLASASVSAIEQLAPILTLGLHHEQQHQELILTDLKHAFAGNPLRPIYRDREPDDPIAEPCALTWIKFDAGLRQVGHAGHEGFAFDNENPRHAQYVEAYEFGCRPSTNRDYLAFIFDGGYDRPEFWLSDGWAARKSKGWSAPLYWEQANGQWMTMTLAGMTPLHLDEPVTHVSFYEADAFARWSDARLCTEAEWENAASSGQDMTSHRPGSKNMLESGRYHPSPIRSEEDGLIRMFGDVWEWTRSPYSAYPGYKPAAGALGEYNGKFMCNQMVLKGGSCATPSTHIRASYRNFFGPEARWQFSGIRLARDLS